MISEDGDISKVERGNMIEKIIMVSGNVENF